MVLAKVVLNRKGQSVAVDAAMVPHPASVGNRPSVALATLFKAAI